MEKQTDSPPKNQTPRQRLAVLLMAAGGLLLVMAVLFGGVQNTASGQVSGTDEEQRLARTLSTIRGAGQVQVMISYTGQEEQAAAVFGGATAQPNTVAGVIVVAEGAGNLSVRAALLQAVQTALSLKPSQVDVFVMQP